MYTRDGVLPGPGTTLSAGVFGKRVVSRKAATRRVRRIPRRTSRRPDVPAFAGRPRRMTFDARSYRNEYHCDQPVRPFKRLDGTRSPSLRPYAVACRRGGFWGFWPRGEKMSRNDFCDDTESEFLFFAHRPTPLHSRVNGRAYVWFVFTTARHTGINGQNAPGESRRKKRYHHAGLLRTTHSCLVPAVFRRTHCRQANADVLRLALRT